MRRWTYWCICGCGKSVRYFNPDREYRCMRCGKVHTREEIKSIKSMPRSSTDNQPKDI